MNPSRRKLYLIPSLLAPDTRDDVLPPKTIAVLAETEYFFVEEIRTARRFLSDMKTGRKIEDLKFYKLDKETTRGQILADLKEIPAEKNLGIISEAGCPGVADPGSLLVTLAHEKNWEVIPMVGPSSILLALMASGLNGQNFAFLGYLPIEKDQREKALREIEKESFQKKRTQIFMETPYRNDKLLEDLLRVCHPDTWLSVAAELTSPEQFIRTRRVKEWKAHVPELSKKPCIFLLASI